MIYVLDSEHKKVFSKIRKGIKEIACEKWFYDIDVEGLEPPKYEKLFGEYLEKDFTEALKKVVNEKKITEENKEILAVFLAFQFFRTPRFREWLVNLLKTISIDMIDQYLKCNTSPELLEYYNKKFIKAKIKESNLHMDTLLKYTLLLAIRLYSFNWKLLINKSKVDFITGSEPVYGSGKEHEGPLLYNHFLFNISPKYCLKISSNTYNGNTILNNIHSINEINKKIISISKYAYITNKELAYKYLNSEKYGYKKLNIEKEIFLNGTFYRSKF